MELLERAKTQGWYHTLELPGLTTMGIFDLRADIRHYGIPESLAGKRVLEIGTWDGFWAFELERRGAAEVIALDLEDERELDWPARRRPETFPDEPRGAGFRLAAELRGSAVRREVCSIYHATPEALGGTFDLVFCSAVLIHLRDQLLALERMAALCRGRLVLAEAYDRRLGLLPWPAARLTVEEGPAVVFWTPTIRAWRRMVWAAGFDDVRVQARFPMRARGFSVPHCVLHASRPTS